MARGRQVAEINLLAVVVVAAATLLAVLDKVDPAGVLFLLTGLAIPAKNTGYQDTGAAPVTAVPVPDVGEPPVELAEEELGARRRR